LLERLPGAGDQYWHQDELVWNLVPEPKPELQLASVIALVDFTADNGATRVFPGSHRWAAGRYPSNDEAAVAEMNAGSAIVYLGSPSDGGGAHRGDARRRAPVVHARLAAHRGEQLSGGTARDRVRVAPPVPGGARLRRARRDRARWWLPRDARSPR